MRGKPRNLIVAFSRTGKGHLSWKILEIFFKTFSKTYEMYGRHRVVSRFLSSRFHPKSRRLFPFYFSNITLRIDLLTFGVSSTVFRIAGEMRQLPAYFDNPADSKENEQLEDLGS